MKSKLINNKENLNNTITNLIKECTEHDITTVEHIDIIIQNFMNDIVEFFK